MNEWIFDKNKYKEKTKVKKFNDTENMKVMVQEVKMQIGW